MNADCWLIVLSNLSPRDRCTVRLVNRSCKNLIDHLDDHEISLRIVHHSSENIHWPVSTSTTLKWSSSNFGFTDFKRILDQYPRLVSLEITGFNNLADHHLFSIVDHCPHLKCLEFYSCPYLSEYFQSDFGFHQATHIGWKRLFNRFEYQITRLILEDCDLDNEHFRLLTESCQSLEHLNVANNSLISDYSPLRTHISPHIRVLKVGSKLGVNRQQIRSLFFTNFLINDIVESERCKGLIHLQIHCLLTARLITLVKLKHLKRLTLKFIAFGDVGNNITCHENNILHNLVLISKYSNIYHLHFYQIKYLVSNDFHWLRQQLSTFYGNGWTTLDMIRFNHEQNKSNINLERCASSSTKKTSLQTFYFYSNDLQTIHNQLSLLEIVLKHFSQCSLKEFSVCSLKSNQNEHSENAKYFNKILLKLLYDCKHLQKLRLENLLPNTAFESLYKLLMEIIRKGRLSTFTMSCEQQTSFLQYIESYSLLNNSSDFYNSLSHLLFIARCCEQDDTLTSKQIHNERLEQQLFQYSHRRLIVREQLTQDEWNLRFIMNTQSNNVRHLLFPTNSEPSNSSVSNDNDLSDLCQLLDSSFGLIDHLMDLITLSANYIFILLTCIFMFKPISLLNSTTAVICNYVQNKFLRRLSFS